METNGSYYLIDNEVRYYPASQLVEHPQQPVQLTDFQHKLLIYFLDNPKVVRSHEQISQQVWPNKITTVDAFNKPLGAIRNALSNNTKSQKNHYIKTWSREGYGLGCSCIFIENEQKMKNPISWIIPAFLASIALIVIAFAYVTSVRNPVFAVDNIRKLTSLLETVAEPALTRDGKYIAFTVYHDPHRGQIFAKKLIDRDPVALTQGHSDKMPVWSPSADRLLYQRLENGQCQIRMITFKKPLIVAHDKLLFECNPATFYVSMSFKNNQSFYFTESKVRSGPHSIHLFNLDSKTRSLLLSPQIKTDKKATGFARINYDANQDKLYIIQSLDWHNSEVLVYHNNQLEKVADIDAPLGSVGLFNGSFVYKDSRNRIMLNLQKQPLTTGWHSPILQPTSSANSNKIAFYTGHLYQWNLHSFDTKNAQGKQLTFNIAANRFPIKTADNFYYSSDFTGITQIYRLSDDGKGKPIQLSNFKQNRRATQISVSADGKMLAISYVSRTDCYRLSGDSLKLVKQFEGLIYPSFSLDSQKIMLFKTDDTPEQTSIEFNLKNWQRTGITIPQSQFAIYHRRGIIFTKAGNKGIYLFNNGTTTTINDAITLYTPADISAADDFLYAVDKSDKSVKKIAISGQEVTDLPIKNVGQLYHYQGVIYYTLEKMGKTSIYIGDIIER